jgi:murein DD-endopeptidase MepM/ murein hydrolase activator NlpD
VTSARRGERRLIALGLVMPWLVLGTPGNGLAETRQPDKPASKPAASARPAPSRAAQTPSAGACVHVVRRGESVSRIAQRYRVTRSAIAAANHLVNPDALRAGQKIQIPGCRESAATRVADQTATVIGGDKSQLLARVGPRRIPTRLHISIPDFGDESVVFEWPVDGTVVSGFGRRRAGWHAGVDIRAEPGSPIRAAAAGTVIFSGSERYYGRMVRIEHPDGFITLYAHNLENLVEVGDRVDAGAVIGSVGRTGRASGEHLHFEIRRQGIAYNPIHLLGHEAPILASTPGVPAEVTTAPEDEEDRE